MILVKNDLTSQVFHTYNSRAYPSLTSFCRRCLMACVGGTKVPQGTIPWHPQHKFDVVIDVIGVGEGVIRMTLRKEILKCSLVSP